MARRKTKTPKHKYEWSVVQTVKDMDELCRALDVASAHAFDVESSGLEWWGKDEVCGFGFAVAPKPDEVRAWYIPVRHVKPKGQTMLSLEKRATYKNVSLDRVLKRIAPYLESEEKSTVGANIKYDDHEMMREGVRFRKMRDVQAAARIIFPERRQVALDVLMDLDLGVSHESQESMLRIADSLGMRTTGGHVEDGGMPKLPVAVVGEYCCDDVRWTLLLYRYYLPLIIEGKLSQAFQRECRLIDVVVKMEEAGFPVDLTVLERERVKAKRSRDELEGKIHRAAGREFNIDSTQQLVKVLYDDLKLPCVVKTDSGQRSTKEEALKAIEKRHRIVPMILDYRTEATLLKTYLGEDALPSRAFDHGKGDTRVHPSFHSDGTRTGRFSCSQPNLQNLPKRGGKAMRVRIGFVPPPRRTKTEQAKRLVLIDYSQIEYRLLAHFCKEPKLIEAFKLNRDVHAMTAKVYGLDRDTAKNVNYADIYGAGDEKLSAMTGEALAVVQRARQAQIRHYPRIKRFKFATMNIAKKNGGVRNPFGRWTAVPADRPHIAVNRLIQGTAADLIKEAMVRIDEWVVETRSGVEIIAQVHDELIFLWPQGAPGLLDVIQMMTEFKKADGSRMFRVPITVDVKISGVRGDEHGSWATAHKCPMPGLLQLACEEAEAEVTKAYPGWTATDEQTGKLLEASRGMAAAMVAERPITFNRNLKEWKTIAMEAATKGGKSGRRRGGRKESD